MSQEGTAESKPEGEVPGHMQQEQEEKGGSNRELGVIHTER